MSRRIQTNPTISQFPERGAVIVKPITLGMKSRSIKRRLLRARISLHQTVQKILEINQSRKKLPFFENRQEKAAMIDQELKMLNKIAFNQAKLVKHYERKLHSPSNEHQTDRRSAGER